jgi:uncharacterized protein YecE (DUF72 family)
MQREQWIHSICDEPQAGEGWVPTVLQQITEDISVIFNNNSGGDAASNAKQLMELLGMKPEASAPRQLELF